MHVRVFPAYLPDFSPVEGPYSKVKTYLRRGAKRTQPGLERTIGEAVEAVTPQDARILRPLRLPPPLEHLTCISFHRRSHTNP